MSKARDLANLGGNTSSLATDSEVTAAVAPKADSSTVTTHTSASNGVHGVTGSVVGTGGTQSLSYKTLYNSKVNGLMESANVTSYVLNATQVDIAIDSLASVFLFTANPTANWTWNFDAAVGYMAIGDSYTFTGLVTNGSTAYYNNVVKVMGTAVTPKWQGGTAPTAGNANAIDAYTYTIIKTAANTYTVLGALVKFA